MKISQKYKVLSFLLISLSLIGADHNYAALASRKIDPFTIAVFKEVNFPYEGTPAGFNVEWISKCIDRDYNVTYLDKDALKNPLILNADKIDLLILPYGENVPVEGLAGIYRFIKNGGGIFTVAGKPFGRILRRDKDSWIELTAMSYKRLLSKLGIEYYIIYKTDIAAMATNCRIFNLLFKIKTAMTDQYGLCIKTAEKLCNVPPTKGNVFPFRIPARDFMDPITLTDTCQNYIGAPLVFVKSWKNPYMATEKIPNKSCLIGFVGENHPLDPKDVNSIRRMKEIMSFLSTKVILKSINTEFVSYRQGEPIVIAVEMLNYGQSDKSAEIEISVAEGNKIVFKRVLKSSLCAQEEKKLKTIWKPKSLQGDFYKVCAILKLNGKRIDETNNGFTIWHGEKLKKGKKISVKDKSFRQDNEPFYLYGTNYYETKLGELMWVMPNLYDVERDIRVMAHFGINFLRVHYHPPKWFLDYLRLKGLPIGTYFSALKDFPLPDERSLRIMDAFITLCSKYGIYFQPDIFTLVPEEMGDPTGWIGDVERCKDPEKTALQKGFVKKLVERYKYVPNIIWDLWNEPFLDEAELPFLREWVREIKAVFCSLGDEHLITLGSDESLALKDDLDFVCSHGYDVKVPDLDKPFVIQEIWNESDLTPEGEKNQALKLERDFKAFVKQGAAGFVPWQWTRQSRLWDDAGDSEQWDNELGLCVREDGSLKPAGKIYKALISEVK